MYTDDFINKLSFHPASIPEHRELVSAQALLSAFSDCADFESREIAIGLGSIRVTLCWLDGIVSGVSLGEDIIRPLTEIFRSMFAKDEQAALELMEDGGIFSYSVKKRFTMDDTVFDITHGSCAVIFDSLHTALTFEVRSSRTRSVSEPTLEKSLKGAKDSFVEAVRTNTSLIRRRICSPALKVSETTIGRKTHTKVSILYIEGVVDPRLPALLTDRLNSIDVDSLLSTGTLEEYIVDSPRSPLPQIIHTERPDRFSMYLCDGRVGILVDGLPVGLVLPVTFAEFMKVTGDSSNHFLIATVLTIVRYIGLIIGLFLPALYVAIAMYQQEMIPTKLLISIVEAKQNVPFSTGFEIMGMLLAFSFLQEAGLRLPNPIGDTVSIIGALIVGQSAVEAQVVSPIAIIVVAQSAIACYTLPSQDLGSAVRLGALGLVIGAIAGGLFGAGLLTCFLLLHLAGIDSFGINYSAPLSDGEAFPVFRLLVCLPKPSKKYRDPILNTQDKRRQK